MGASLVYLDKPNKDILHEEGDDGKLSYVASEMQGWRINMVSGASIFFCLRGRHSLRIVNLQES